jgi:hypothetical protein
VLERRTSPAAKRSRVSGPLVALALLGLALIGTGPMTTGAPHDVAPPSDQLAAAER